MTFREWVVSRRDGAGRTMGEIATELGFERRTLFRKLRGQGLTAADMKRINETAGQVLDFSEYIGAAA